jgi:hypothetical protein
MHGETIKKITFVCVDVQNLFLKHFRYTVYNYISETVEDRLLIKSNESRFMKKLPCNEDCI